MFVESLYLNKSDQKSARKFGILIRSNFFQLFFFGNYEEEEEKVEEKKACGENVKKETTKGNRNAIN